MEQQPEPGSDQREQPPEREQLAAQRDPAAAHHDERDAPHATLLTRNASCLRLHCFILDLASCLTVAQTYSMSASLASSSSDEDERRLCKPHATSGRGHFE